MIDTQEYSPASRMTIETSDMQIVNGMVNKINKEGITAYNLFGRNWHVETVKWVHDDRPFYVISLVELIRTTGTFAVTESLRDDPDAAP